MQRLCSLLSNDGERQQAWELSEVPQISEVGQSDIQGKKNIAEEENDQNNHNLFSYVWAMVSTHIKENLVKNGGT